MGPPGKQKDISKNWKELILWKKDICTIDVNKGFKREAKCQNRLVFRRFFKFSWMSIFQRKNLGNILITSLCSQSANITNVSILLFNKCRDFSNTDKIFYLRVKRRFVIQNSQLFPPNILLLFLILCKEYVQNNTGYWAFKQYKHKCYKLLLIYKLSELYVFRDSSSGIGCKRKSLCYNWACAIYRVWNLKSVG